MPKSFLATLFLEPPPSYPDRWWGKCLEMRTVTVMGLGFEEVLQNLLKTIPQNLANILQSGRDLEREHHPLSLWEEAEAKVASKTPCALIRIPIPWPEVSVTQKPHQDRVPNVSVYPPPGVWTQSTQSSVRPFSKEPQFYSDLMVRIPFKNQQEETQKVYETLKKILKKKLDPNLSED